MPTRINEDDARLPDETSITTESTTTKPETDAERVAREAKEKKLQLARRQFRTSVAALQHWRKMAKEDAQFRAGTWGDKTYQWPAGIKEKRDEEKRPCLTVNRAPTFIRQVTNAVRMAHLRILVKAVDSKGDPKVAEIIQGWIRNVEVNSLAEWVYNTASDKQAEGGLGWMEVATEYAHIDGDDCPDDELFRLRVRLKRKRRPLSIYPDPAADNPDFSDGKFLFEVTDHDAAEYEEITGQKPVASEQSGFAADGDETGDWFPNGKHRIARWYNLEPKGPRQRKGLLASGKVVDLPDAPLDLAAQKAILEAAKDPVVRERIVQKHVMMARKITATEILEETEWPDRGTPFFAVPGDELEIDGERDWRGVIRDSKDSGRIYNVEVSALVEAVGTGTNASLIGYRGTFGAPDSDLRRSWDTATTVRKVYREVEPVDIDGKTAPLPRMESFEPPIGGVIEAIHQADQDYKTTAGFHEASLAEQGPQESGKAILARQRQDELGSSHYLDNHRGSMTSMGRQMIRLFRVVCDVPTVVRITGKDDKERSVMVFSGADNDPRSEQFLKTHDGPGPMAHPTDASRSIAPGDKIPFQLPKGVKEIYDIGVGEFDIEVSTGKDSGTRREENVELLATVFKVLPPEMAVKFLDLYFLMMDSPMAQQMAERAKTMLPPELQDDEDGEDMPPAAKAKIAQAKAIVEKLMQELQELKKEQDAKTLDLASRERIAAAANASKEKITQEQTRSKEKVAGVQVQADLAKTEAELNAEQALADISAQLEHFRTTLGQLHEARMASAQRLHEATQAHVDRGHEREMAASAAEAAAAAAAAAPDTPAAGGPA